MADYTMEDMHEDGVHDGEMYKWERMCSLCSNQVEMALDSYEGYLESQGR